MTLQCGKGTHLCPEPPACAQTGAACQQKPSLRCVTAQRKIHEQKATKQKRTSDGAGGAVALGGAAARGPPRLARLLARVLLQAQEKSESCCDKRILTGQMLMQRAWSEQVEHELSLILVCDDCRLQAAALSNILDMKRRDARCCQDVA